MIIQHDQVGFILQIQAWFHIWESINIIHYINKLKEEKHMIISLDAKKAFENIQPPYPSLRHQVSMVLGTSSY